MLNQKKKTIKVKQFFLRANIFQDIFKKVLLSPRNYSSVPKY